MQTAAHPAPHTPDTHKSYHERRPSPGHLDEKDGLMKSSCAEWKQSRSCRSYLGCWSCRCIECFRSFRETGRKRRGGGGGQWERDAVWQVAFTRWVGGGDPGGSAGVTAPESERKAPTAPLPSICSSVQNAGLHFLNELRRMKICSSIFAKVWLDYKPCRWKRHIFYLSRFGYLSIKDETEV